MNLFSRNWQWNCDPFQSKCKRFHEKIHARNDSFHYLEGCKSVCGTYGSIWPQPTGQSVIQHELKAFNIEDLAVKFDPKTTNQFLDEALTGKVEKIFKGSLDSIPSPFPFRENSNYGQESLLEV